MNLEIVRFARRRYAPGSWIFNAVLWSALVVFGAGWACQSNSKEQPTLSDEKIARIMADISIADAATNGLTAYPKDSLMQVYFKQVFEIHGISLEDYEKDLRILAKDLPRMQGIVKMADELLTEEGKDLGNKPK